MQDVKAREQLALGHDARRAGRFAEALAFYAEAASLAPENAEANSVYGLLLLRQGRREDAEAPLRKAVALEPTHIAFRMNLSEWHALAGQFDEARALVEPITREAPDFHWAWERLGDLSIQTQRFDDAAAFYTEAAQRRPGDPSIRFKAARARFDAGDADAALRTLEDAAALAPQHEAILRLFAEIHEAQTRWADLERVAQAWLQVRAQEPLAWRALARAQWESGRPRLAMDSFQQAMRLAAPDAETLATYGRLCITALEYDAADEALARAESLDPNSSHMLSAQAILQMFRGRFEAAQAYCRRSIANNPKDAIAYKTLVQLARGRIAPEEAAALHALTEGADLAPWDRASATFAFGEHRDGEGDVEGAFDAFARANAMARDLAAREGLIYDRDARARQIDELISLFPNARDAPAPVAATIPIFIVGMPRSGTTLIESVIGAHSQVFACGERPEMRWIAQDFMTRVRAGASPAAVVAAERGRWRDWFFRDMPDLGGATAVTDKNPWNYDAIGLILEALPDARVIHVQRNPVDVGFSIFRNEFSKFVPFAYRLEDIAHYYGQYARLMAHWAQTRAGRYTVIQYEDFLRAFDDGARALIAACGLAWEDACAVYWKGERVISTLSTIQARQPPGLRAPGGGRYARLLAPLADALAAEGVDLETGALRA
ncbi:MAG: tetratricopeptide repeat protein [Alphaproteobacteria bacterium]|nr:tetratricopeptide repeat protein [Alphaproteobacteria bacterium]